MMLKKILKNINKRDQGSMAIEFAFVMPVVLLLLFGFFEFCMVVFTLSILNYSAEEATRYAMVSFDAADPTAEELATLETNIKNVARESFILINEDNISSFSIDITENAPGGIPDATFTVGVTIDYTYTISMPFMTSTSFTLSGNSQSFLVQAGLGA